MPFLNSFPPPKTRLVGPIFAAWVVMWFPLLARGQDGPALVAALEDSFTKIIESAEPSVVSIARIGQPPKPQGDMSGERLAPHLSAPQPDDFIPSEFGAGVIFEPADQPGKRFILTMYHVVKGGRIAGRNPSSGDELVIHTHKRQRAQVEILAADPRSDLAVLQIVPADPNAGESRPGEGIRERDLTPIRMAEKPRYKKGQFVLTLGNPYAIARDGSASAGWGLVSNISRSPKPAAPDLMGQEKVKAETIHHQGTLLQIDGQLNLGTSGGAVLDRQGELIGIITAMAALDGYEKSVGYAVPLGQGIQRIITELAHGYEAEYGFLGIIPKTVPYAGGEQPTAVSVEPVGSLSPAVRAGVSLGDLIYAVNDVTIYTREDLMREIALIGPGKTANLKIYRPQPRQWLTKEVTLAKWPVLNEADIIATEHRYPFRVLEHNQWNNIVIDHATARYDHFQEQYRPAVLITGIERQSPDVPSQLRVGDFITHVDNRPVRSPEEFQAAVKGKTGPVQFRLLDQNRTVTLRVSE